VKIDNATNSLAFLEYKLSFYDVKTLSPSTYNAGVVVVNLKVVGLARGLKEYKIKLEP
jgi:hypothetical protein